MPTHNEMNQLVALFNMGRYVEVENQVQSLLEQDPSFGFGWKVLGAALKVQGKDAVLALQQAATLLPDDAEAHCNLGVTQQDLGQLENAAASFRRALAIKYDYSQACCSLGNVLQSLGSDEEAVDNYRRALEIDPNYFECHANLAMTLQKLGQVDDATASFRRALELRPTLRGDLYLNMANSLMGLGRYADAVKNFREAIVVAPDSVEALNNFGNCLKLLSQLEEAAVCYRRALQIDPRHVGAYNNLGATLHELGQFYDAAESYRKALAIAPANADAHYNLGNASRALRNSEVAVSSYKRAIELRKNFLEAHNNLAIVLHELGQLDGAVASYLKVLEIKPDIGAAHHFNLGNALKGLGRFNDAAARFRRATEIEPHYAEAHINLGNSLQEIGRLYEAIASYERALQINPRDAKVHCNLGIVLQESGQVDVAVKSFRQALECQSDFAVARLALGYALLQLGEFSEGWPKCEFRWEGANPLLPRAATSLPQWCGQTPRSGDGILIFVEQGMGDILQFVRYLSLVASRFSGRTSIVVDGSLHTLFSRSFPNWEILNSVPVEQSAWRWQCPLLSLPLAFNTTLETIPRTVSYLVPDPNRVAYWKSRIGTLGLPDSTPKIGLVWKTGRYMKNAELRSVSLHRLDPLLSYPGLAFFSLQKEPDEDEMSWAAAGKLVNWSSDFSDFDDTAGLVQNLDLVISVDTSVAHLAGGLGKSTWLLNRHASEWRWMRDREDSSWYPTMRIFTQAFPGDWDQVVRRVIAALADWMPTAILLDL